MRSTKNTEDIWVCRSAQVPGGVTAAKGFQAAGMYGGLRAAGRKPDLALVVCETDAVSAGKTPPKLLFSQILRGRQRVAVAISSYHSSSYVFNCHVSEYMSELSVRKALKKGQKTTPTLPPS